MNLGRIALINALGTYSTNSQIKSKSSVLTSSLCDFSDSYILVKGTITFARVAAPAPADNTGEEVVFKNCAPFTNCINEISNRQIDNAKYIDVIMPMYNLMEYSNNYSKKSRRLWQYYRDEPAFTDAGATANFHSAGKSDSFKFKQNITGVNGDNGTKNVEITVPLKYLSNFWRTLEMALLNCEINLILTWSDQCVLSNDTKATTFAVADAKLYVPVLTLSTQDNAKPFE